MPITVGSYRVLVGWEGRLAGLFTIGRSLVGGGDLITTGFGISTVPSGTYDDVTSYSSGGVLQLGTTEVHIRRGRTTASGQVNVGTCDITVYDRSGWLIAQNAASPLYGSVLPMRPVVVQVDTTGSGNWVSVYRGWLAQVESKNDWGEKYAVLHCRDSFLWMERAKNPTIGSIGTSYIGTCFSTLLQTLGMNNTSEFVLDNGMLVPDFSADATQGYLQIASNLVTADLGMFFFAKDGKPTYYDRTNAAGRASEATFTSGEEVVPGIDIATLFNRATATKTGGVQQVYEDSSSQGNFGYSDAGEVTSPYFLNDAAAASNTAYRVVPYTNGQPPVWRYTLEELGSATVAQLANLDLGDRITVNQGVVSTQDFIIQGMDVVLKAGQLIKAQLLLSQAPNWTPFLVGSSLVGGTDVLP